MRTLLRPLSAGAPAGRRRRKWASAVAAAVAVATLLAGCDLRSGDEPAEEPVAARASVGDNFLAASGAVPTSIALDRVGVLLRDPPRAGVAKRLAAQRGWRVLRSYNRTIVIFGLPARRTRRELVVVARGLREANRPTVAQAGLVVTPRGAKTPMLLTDELIVQMRRGAAIAPLATRFGFRVLMQNPFVRGQFVVAVTGRTRLDALETANRVRAENGVVYAEPNFVRVKVERETNPNDPLYASQWHHRNTGASLGTADADADADTSLAWDLSQGAAGTLIAVIDSGIETTHPDFAANLSVNAAETAGNNVDDDGNGFVDDINGWDFSGCASPTAGCGDNNPAGGNHGTAVAGLAAARGNNSLGVSGSCPNCRLLLIRFGGTDFADGLAFGYAQARGAQVITNSWGFSLNTPCATNLCNAINNAATNGRGGLGSVVLFAMNNPAVNDCVGPQPDISSLPNVIAVSRATNQDRFSSGGFGDCMDILSPTARGTLDVATTDRQGTAGYNNTSTPASCPSTEPSTPANARDYTLCFSGTSAATPIAAGVAGLVVTVAATLNRLQVQRLLQDTADKVEPGAAAYATQSGFSRPAGGNATHGFGRLNAFEAVRVAAPAAQGGRGGQDIFIRDNRLDWGNTERPSNVLFEATRGFLPHWESVDIKVDAPPLQPAPTTSGQFDAFVDENPRGNETNRLYVRLRNRGPSTIAAATVKLHWAFAGAGLPALPNDFWSAFPVDSADQSVWHSLGTQPLSNLVYSGASVAGTAGDAAQVVGFDFAAPDVDPTQPDPNHYCLFAIARSAGDPVSAASRASLIPDVITPSDNNVTHRNVHLEAAIRSERAVELLYVNNPFRATALVTLRLRAPRGWTVSSRPTPFDRPTRVDGRSRVLVTLVISRPRGAAGTVEVIQETRDPKTRRLVRGGMTYSFRK